MMNHKRESKARRPIREAARVSVPIKESDISAVTRALINSADPKVVCEELGWGAGKLAVFLYTEMPGFRSLLDE